MELARLVAETVRYMAWPVLILAMFLMLRKPLIHLIGRLREYEGRYGSLLFGETEETPQQPVGEKKIPSELSAEAKKILATLWERQRFHFGDDRSKRWSFRILPNTPVYGTFTIGFAELLKAGLVGWTQPDGQALLTNEGIEYIKKRSDIQESEDRYRL